jgi:multidrug efflux pump subunit AcrA (membrane-fusion protein)
MSGETEANISGWTVDTLHTHLIRQLDLLREQIREQHRIDERARDLAFDAQKTAMQAALTSADRAVAAALAAQKEAVTVANVAAEKRADIQNEWRQSLNDVLTRAMPRAEAEAVFSRATERIQELLTGQQNMVTRAELEAARTRDSERFNELATRVTHAEALVQGAQANKAAILAAIGVAVALITIVSFVANFLSQ